MITRPGVTALYRQLDKARNWSINDPRIAKLAEKIIRISALRETVQMAGYNELTADILGVSLIDQFSANNASPALEQLRDTVRELSKNK